MTEIAHRNPAQDIVARVRGDQFREQVEMALPPEVKADRFLRVLASALMENVDLAEKCDHASIYQAAIKCAATGLMPDGNEAALIPYQNKKANRTEAKFIPMIGGYRKIVADYGWALQTAAIYANDEFEYEMGVNPHVTHRAPRLGESRGALIGGYAVATHRDGRRMFEVMDAAEIEHIRQKASRASKFGPWVDWPERMYEKTVGRRLFKKIPLAETERDETRARIVQLITAAEESPVEAAGALYGDSGREAFQIEAGLPAPPASETQADEPPLATEDGPQAGEGQPSAPSPVPGGDVPFGPPDAVVAAAGEAVVPNIELVNKATGVLQPIARVGESVGDIVMLAGTGDADAVRWIRWALGFADWPDGFGGQLRVYLSRHLPSLLGERS